ncbi:MAG: energy-coupling factor ABC transporter permease [Gammaproteobacteria bacterium]
MTPFFMDIPAGLLPAASLWLAAVIYAMLLTAALVTAPWSKLADTEAINIYFGSVAAVTVLWVMRAGIEPGYNYHLLGITTLCLMFDWQFALLAASLVLVVTTWQGPAGWETFAMNALVMGALPVVFTRVLLYFSQRRLPHNFFIYIFINAFLAGALSMLLSGLAASGALALAPAFPGGNYLQVIPLLMFGEAFLNGMLMTLLVAYKPRWVATFHDRWYLNGQ